MSLLRQLFRKRDFLSYCLLIFLSLSFFWKFFLKGLVPIPADTIVGIYYPWRDHIWNNLVAGVPIKNGLLSDVVSIIYPWRIYGVELLKQGIWPLWIPHALGGMPLLANFQSGLFYPLNFLFWIFSNVNAWSIYIILQPILASLFCFFFLRNLKLEIFPSLIGSFIFAFGGFSLVWLEYGIVGHAGLWLPLILLSIDKLLNKSSNLWMILGALAVAFCLLAGYPQISFFVLLIACFYGTFRIFVAKEGRNQRTILALLAFPLLGICLAAVQLLPSFELWQLSLRQQDPTAAAFNFGLNPLKNLILFLAPDFYGNPTTANFWGWGAYNEAVSYVSVAGFLLAVIAFIGFEKEKTLIFFKGLLIVSLLMVFANPLSNFIYSLRLPILAGASAARFFYITQFSLSILAAFGAQSLLTGKKVKRQIILSLTLIIFPFLGLLGIVFLKPEIWPSRDLLENLRVAQRNLVLPFFLLFFSSFLVFIAKQQNLFISVFPLSLKVKNLILLLLLWVIVFDLFRFGFKYTPFTNRDYLYPETKLTNFLKEQKTLYRFTGLIPQSMFIPYNLSSVEGYEPLMIKRYSEFANQINEEKFSRISSGSRWVIVHRHESPLLDLLGTKYLLSFNPEPKSGWDPQYFKYPKERYELVFQYGKSQIYENKEVLPRAFIVHDFQVLTDEEILKTLMNKNFNPRQILLLEEKPENSSAKKAGEDRVIIEEGTYFQNQVSLKANLVSDGFLFLSDNYYPGWQASVDGQPTKIYRANYTFRAVFVPKGEHTVKFLFQPQLFKICLGISLVAFLILVILVGFLIYEVFKSRYSSPQRFA